MLLDLEYLLSKYKIVVDAVLQPGAHFGQESSLYDRIGIPDNNRYYFEPQPHVFKVLRDNIGDRGHLFNFALGNENRPMKMNIERDNQSQSSSLLSPGLHTTQYPHIRFTESLDVNVFRLDDVFPANKLNRKWLLNIDCQGFELEVLSGGRKILPYTEAIICEVNRAEVYMGCPMVEEIDEFLKPFDLSRVETNWEGVSWGDALYIR